MNSIFQWSIQNHRKEKHKLEGENSRTFNKIDALPDEKFKLDQQIKQETVCHFPQTTKQIQEEKVEGYGLYRNLN